MAHLLRSFVIVVVLSVLGEHLCSAQSVPAAPDSIGASAAFRGPTVQDPRELEQALLSANPAEASHLLWRFSCVPNPEAAYVVQQAWELRDSAGSSGATRDPVVRTLMAKCLAEAWPRFRPLEPGDAPVLAQLRLSLGSSNPEEVQAAAFGLSQTAAAEDVQAMVGAAERLPSLRSLMTVALGQVCRVDAIEGARTIKARVTDARQLAEIENIEAHAATMRRVLCGFDANIVGSAVSQADIDDFLMVDHSGPTRPSVEITTTLNSTDVRKAQEILRKLRCRPEEKETQDQVRMAWQRRNSAPPNSAMRNADVRALMARCLAKDDADTLAASQSHIPKSAVEELRRAVSGSDAFAFIDGVEGLTRIATAADVRLIENELKGRAPTFSGIAVQNLTRSCAPGAMDAVLRIRERISKPVVRRDIDFQILATQRVREFVCAKRGGERK